MSFFVLEHLLINVFNINLIKMLQSKPLVIFHGGLSVQLSHK